MQVKTESRDFTIHVDEPEDAGGTNKYMNPVEVLLCSLGSCLSIVVASFAGQHDINYDEFYIDLEGDIDLAGFKGEKDVRPGYQEIRYKMHFETDEPKDKIEEFVEFVEDHCPVLDSIENEVKFVNTGVIVE